MQDSFGALLASEQYSVDREAGTITFANLLSPVDTGGSVLISSWPYGITYFWLLGQVLCEAQPREHSRSYVTAVVAKHDCMDAGAGRSSIREWLNKKSEIYDFIWLATYTSKTFYGLPRIHFKPE